MKRLKQLLLQFLGLFPTKLPIGITEFNFWADSFFDIYDLPTKDKDSVHYALATMIINGGQQMTHRPKYFFYKTLVAGAQRQVAGQVFYDIKTRQKALADAEAKKANETAK